LHRIKDFAIYYNSYEVHMSQWENWDILKKHVKHKWGKLTDQDLLDIDGIKPRLIEKLELRYEWKREHAEEAIRQFEKELEHGNLKHKKHPYPGKPTPRSI